jgi:hypothetical protein
VAITGPSDLQPGDVLLIGPAASPKFTEPFRLRLHAVVERLAPPGWCFVDGDVLDERGNAIQRRTIFVQVRGLVREDPGTATRREWRLDNNRGHHFRAD